VEINSQTDFVAMSDNFIKLVDEITLAIFRSNAKTIEEALVIKTHSNITVEEACIQLTAKIGEKIIVRRFMILEKSNDEVFAHYTHSNNKISVLLKLKPQSNVTAGRDVAMHAAAMAPRFLSQNEVDPN
jgi:elongation factor Ts